MVNVYHPFRFFFVLFLDNLQKDACSFGTPEAFRNLYIPYLYCAYLFIFSFFILIFVLNLLTKVLLHENIGCIHFT